MAQKIDGFLDGTGEVPEFIPHKEGNRYIPFWEEQGISTGLGLWRPATIVLHKGKRAERVFTESEVRAMVREMVEGVMAGEELTLETIAERHGIVLDPA